jgi:4-amino-4-deoxy-L-arabinose transferase-like glycosyltransferase
MHKDQLPTQRRHWRSRGSGLLSSWRTIVIVLLLALLLRGAYLRTAPRGAQFSHVDAEGYHWLARNLLERGVFSINTEPPFHPNHVRAPLYPLFVAAIYKIAGPSPDFVAFVHALVDVLTVAVLFRLGTFVVNKRIGALAALLYAMNPSSWRFCNELLTEIFFGLLLTLSVWMFARYLRWGWRRDALRCGLTFGLAILCKPNIQFLPLALLGIMLHGLAIGRRQWWQGVLIVAGAILLLLSPWVIRNRIVFGDWFYTRTFDDNLAHVSAVATLAEVSGERVAPWSARWEALYDEVVTRTALAYGWSEVEDRDLTARQRDARLQQSKAVAIEILREHPLDFFVSHTRSWLRSFIPQEHRFWYTHLTGTPWEAIPIEGDALGRALRAMGAGQLLAGLQILIRERLLVLPPLALALWISWAVGYGIAAVLFIVGALRLRPRILSLFIVLTIIYVTFVPGPISQIRFRLPVMPLILLLVAAELPVQLPVARSGLCLGMNLPYSLR